MLAPHTKEIHMYRLMPRFRTPDLGPRHLLVFDVRHMHMHAHGDHEDGEKSVAYPFTPAGFCQVS